jgi:hypothetical protein
MTGTVALQAAELIPSGFNVPEYLALAGAIAVGGIYLDRRKGQLDNELEQSLDGDEARLGLADPFIAETTGLDNRRTRLAERVGYYAAIAGATFAVVQFGAQPFNSHSRAKANATVVIDAGDAANVTDMQGGISRLQASVDGSLAAKSQDKAPFSFILAGSYPKTVVGTKQAINKAITPSFQNGDSLANSNSPGGDSVADALSGPQPNDIIIIGSAVNPGDVAGIQAVEKQVKSSSSKDTLSAVVVGSTNTTNQIGIATVNAPVNVQSFRSLLGSSNVKTATTTAGVQDAITGILNHAKASENKQPNNDAEDVAILAAAVLALVAAGRRLSGITKLKPSKRRK